MCRNISSCICKIINVNDEKRVGVRIDFCGICKNKVLVFKKLLFKWIFCFLW